MPNHVKNWITADCTVEQFEKLLEEVGYRDPEGKLRIGTLDFEKIIPMPEEIFRGNLDLSSREKYGEMNWYDWSVKNWGTKWNSYDGQQENELTISFSTAWNAPYPVIRELSRKYPDYVFTHAYADEDLGYNFGKDKYQNGEVIDREIFRNEKEEMDFVMEVWGLEPRDCDLALNLSMDGYVYVEGEDYPAVLVNGQMGLLLPKMPEAKDFPVELQATRWDPDTFSLDGEKKQDQDLTIVTRYLPKKPCQVFKMGESATYGDLLSGIKPEEILSRDELEQIQKRGQSLEL